MNFNIRKGGDSPEFIREFIGLYNNKDLRVSQIAKKLYISENKYRRIKKELVEAGRIDPDLRVHTPRYYTYNKSDKKYRVFKTIKGKAITFGSFNNEEDAKKAVELCKKYGWNIRKKEKIRCELYARNRY